MICLGHTDVSLMRTNDNTSKTLMLCLEHVDVSLTNTNDNSSTH